MKKLIITTLLIAAIFVSKGQSKQDSIYLGSSKYIQDWGRKDTPVPAMHIEGINDRNSGYILHVVGLKFVNHHNTKYKIIKTVKNVKLIKKNTHHTAKHDIMMDSLMRKLDLYE
jgi:hypothetical protein